VSDQRDLWNSKHAGSSVSRDAHPTSPLAREIIARLAAPVRILELGCGWGVDAAAFARAGHSVLATDFSETAIAANRAHWADVPGLTFEQLPIRAPFPFADAAFDVVYAHLSLHYLPNPETRAVFNDLHRILTPGGTLAFLCKSVADPLYGRGDLIEADMYSLNGHVRHFFSVDYARSCLEGRFTIDDLSTGDTAFYGSESAFIQVIARPN
jgi:SAM-dependent methyltransferase